MVDTYGYSSPWADSLRAKGRAEGEAKGRAEDVLRILGKRGIDVPEEARERISACRDLDQLDTWIDRSITITHIDELFDE